MNNDELSAYRLKIIREATQMKKTDRVPHFSFFVTWKILDSGYKLTEAMSDYNIMEKVIRTHQEKYCFDQIMETGTRNNFLLADALGYSGYMIDDKNEAINYTDFVYCEHDELPQMAADYNRFVWEKAMPRKYPFWNKDFELEKIQKALDAFLGAGAFATHIRKVVNEDYGIPNLYAPNPVPSIPIENIFSCARGIKGFSVDMRKDPQYLEALIEERANVTFYPVMKQWEAMNPKPSDNACFDSGTAILAHTVLNNKQWEKYFWPYLKQVIEFLAERNMNYMMFAEGSMLRFADYFKDIPKGTITILPENDDVFEIRKTLPNFAIMGGMDNYLLYNGGKQECLDRAKRLIDELGGEGGYIMTQNKMGSFKTDANAENLKAVSDFILNYAPSQN